MDRNELGILALLTKRITEMRADIRALSRQPGPRGEKGDVGADGVAGKDGAPGRDGKDGRPGKDGRDGVDGKEGRPGKNGADGKEGPPGPSGPPPKHEWDGTKLRFENSDGKWGKFVDLKGQPGKPGSNGGGVFASTPSARWDPDALPEADADTPEEFIVKQNGIWARATYAQMQSWLGGSGGLPANAVLVNGTAVTVNGQIVTAG